MGRTTLVLFLLAVTACGSDRTVVVVNVDFSGYEVPTQLNKLHFELSDAGGIFGERSYDLDGGEGQASVALVPGGMTPSTFVLVVYGFLDDFMVAQSAAAEVTVKEEQMTRVHVEI